MWSDGIFFLQMNWNAAKLTSAMSDDQLLLWSVGVLNLWTCLCVKLNGVWIHLQTVWSQCFKKKSEGIFFSTPANSFFTIWIQYIRSCNHSLFMNPLYFVFLLFVIDFHNIFFAFRWRARVCAKFIKIIEISFFCVWAKISTLRMVHLLCWIHLCRLFYFHFVSWKFCASYGFNFQTVYH